MQSKSTRNQIKAMWAVMAMLTAWCIINTVKINTFMPDMSSINKTINILLNRVNTLENAKEEIKEAIPQSIEEAISFDDTFRQMRAEHGPDNIFVWNGEEYTTDYFEEVNQ